jgi:lipopolysaccharide transport system ATP-binding protein
MSDVVLSANGISKKFSRDFKLSLAYGVRDVVSEVFPWGSETHRTALRKSEFWALNEVSFEVRKGESVGLIGANGCGKTTLLRIISGLIKPNAGNI